MPFDLWQHGWTVESIETQLRQLARNEFVGSYGKHVIVRMQELIRQHIMPHIKKEGHDDHGHVLVIGSTLPWVEVILLAEGVGHITTLDYVPIECEHPKITTMTPSEMAKLVIDGAATPAFDAMVTFSSIEHSGLGRSVMFRRLGSNINNELRWNGFRGVSFGYAYFKAKY